MVEVQRRSRIQKEKKETLPYSRKEYWRTRKPIGGKKMRATLGEKTLKVQSTSPKKSHHTDSIWGLAFPRKSSTVKLGHPNKILQNANLRFTTNCREEGG